MVDARYAKEAQDMNSTEVLATAALIVAILAILIVTGVVG